MTTPWLIPDSDREPPIDGGFPVGLKIFLAITALIIIGVLVWHLTGGGMGNHGM